MSLLGKDVQPFPDAAPRTEIMRPRRLYVPLTVIALETHPFATTMPYLDQECARQKRNFSSNARMIARAQATTVTHWLCNANALLVIHLVAATARATKCVSITSLNRTSA